MEKTTIVALATPPAKAALAIVRLSGPNAIGITDRIWMGRRPLAETEPRKAILGTIAGPDGQPLDQAVVTIYRAPASFTGEDSVEITVHGSTYIASQLIEALVQAGATPASPGEYSMRAFLNGRLDLAQAEAIADLIGAESRAAHRLAYTQASGQYSARLTTLHQQLLHLLSLIELELDFSEEDVQFASRNQFLQIAYDLQHEIDSLIATYRAGCALKDGITVVITGLPNAGKSTLLNALAGDTKAIVSDIPGTTRDLIEATVLFHGLKYRFIDTAGLRSTDDPIESQGISLAADATSRATMIIRLIDSVNHLNAGSQLDELRRLTPVPQGTPEILVVNKADRIRSIIEMPGLDLITLVRGPIAGPVGISALKGEHIGKLWTLLHTIATKTVNPSDTLLITNARHLEALRSASASLGRLIDAIAADLPTDLIAQEARHASASLADITGSITTPDILRNIFSHFCIGK